jgi:hypothetical protein
MSEGEGRNPYKEIDSADGKWIEELITKGEIKEGSQANFLHQLVRLRRNLSSVINERYLGEENWQNQQKHLEELRDIRGEATKVSREAFQGIDNAIGGWEQSNTEDHLRFEEHMNDEIGLIVWASATYGKENDSFSDFEQTGALWKRACERVPLRTTALNSITVSPNETSPTPASQD